MTDPVILPSGPRVRLTAPQWHVLRRVMRAWGLRPRLHTWLARELWPEVSLGTLRLLGTREAKGALERVPRGSRLIAAYGTQRRPGVYDPGAAADPLPPILITSPARAWCAKRRGIYAI